MTTKSFRLTDEDEKKLETVRYQLNEAYGIDTDSGIFKFLLSQYIASKDKIKVSEKTKPELPEELQIDIDEYTVNPKNYFCPNHADQILADCECFSNGEYVIGLKRSYGL